MAPTIHRDEEEGAPLDYCSVLATICIAAALLCCKLGAWRTDSAAPSQVTIGLAARELLLASGAAAGAGSAAAKVAEAEGGTKVATSASDAGKAVSADAEKGKAQLILQQKVGEAEVPAAGGEQMALPPSQPVAKGDEEGRKAAGAALIGWDKGQWSLGDWASWVITGPGITVAFAFFMFYTYGVPAGVLTFLICGCIDTMTFYYNW